MKKKNKDRIIDIYVSRDDIMNGFPGSPFSCPITKAVIRKIPEAEDVFVYNKVTVKKNSLFFNTKEVTKYDLPPKAHKFINRFDAGKKVEPFSFRMRRCP